MDVCATELVARPVGVDGGCRSEHALVELPTIAVPEASPAAS